MISKGWVDYFLIRVCIIGFRSIAPISFIYLAYSWFQGKFQVSSWLGIYAAVEVSFYLIVYLPRRSQLQKAAIHPPPLDRAQRQALFEKCANNSRNIDDYPSEWFFAPDVKRENVIDWILWSLFSAEPHQIREEWQDEINGYVAGVEETLGRELEHGYNKDANAMRLTFDPVVMIHRPVVWYMIVAGVDAYTSLRLFFLKFHHYTTPTWFEAFPPRPLTTILSRESVDIKIPYWYHPHRSKTKLPILFIHGIGIGLYPYIPFFMDLMSQDPDVGILAIEILPVSMRMTGPPLSRERTCLAISRILVSLNLSQVVVVSHSYGTVVATHLLHSPLLAPRIAATLFIDPIPFLLQLPNVAYNFVYRKPYDANEWQLWFFASRDPDISRALSRHFFWVDNVLWKEELEGLKVAVSLSGDDQIVHAEEVRRYLTGDDEMHEYWCKDGLEVLFYPGLDHATVFDTRQRRQPLLDTLHRFVKTV